VELRHHSPMHLQAVVLNYVYRQLHPYLDPLNKYCKISFKFILSNIDMRFTFGVHYVLKNVQMFRLKSFTHIVMKVSVSQRKGPNVRCSHDLLVLPRLTALRAPVSHAPTSYSGGPEFKFLSGVWQSLLRT
jgi:hypothetical protein